MRNSNILKYSELFITLVIFLLAIIFFAIVHDDYGSFFLNMAAGQFSDFSFIDLHYMGLIGFNHVYKYLYHAFPGMSHLGIAFLFFQLFGSYLFLRTIRVHIIKGKLGVYGIWCIQILFSLFFLENLITLSHTRFALMFCGLALFNLLFSEKVSKKAVFLNAILFVIGMLHRPESSVGMLLLVSGGFLLYKLDVKHLVKRIFVPAGFAVGLFAYFTIDRLHTDIYIRQVEPEIEYKMMDGHYVPLSAMQTPVDTVKYLAAVNGMWFDTHTLSPTYLRSLLQPGTDLSLAHMKDIFVHLLPFYGHYLFIPFFLLLLCAITLLRKDNKALIQVLGISLFTFAVLYALDFNGSLVDKRHCVNIQLIALLMAMFCFFEGYKKSDYAQIPKMPVLLLVILVVSSSAITLSHYYNDNKAASRLVECYETTMEKVDAKYNNRIIVSTLSNVYLLNHNFSVKDKIYTNNTHIMYDMFTYSLIPEYVAYLSRICSCDAGDPVVFFTWLAKVKAIYIGERDRLDLTMSYMRHVHGMDLQLLVVDSIPKPACIYETGFAQFQTATVYISQDK